MSDGRSDDWREVSKRERCPICDHDDWCGITGPENDPDAAYCMREKSDLPKKDGWIHKIKQSHLSTPTDSRQTRRKRESVKNNGERKSKQRFSTSDAAVAKLEELYGYAAASWPYMSSAGVTTMIVLRWNLPDGKKTIRPVYRDHDGQWIIGHHPEPRPLYQLPEIVHASRVVVVEGEPCALALANLGIEATTAPGGALAADKADWSPLAGKVVIIWRDNDANGLKYQQTILEELRKLDPPPKVSVIEPVDNWPAKYDAADAIEGGATREQIEDILATAEPVEFQPAERVVGYLPFPVDCFPSQLRDYVVALAESIGVDPAMVGLPLLAAMAAAIGNSRNVRVRPGWEEICSLLIGMLGESGSGKTPAAKAILAPIRERDAKANRRRQADDQEFAQRQAEYDADLAAWKALRKKGGTEPAPDKPTRPPRVRYMLMDATIEKVAEVLGENPRGVALLVDELSSMLGSMGRYDGNKGAERGAYLSAWSGEPMIVDRKVSTSAYVENPRISIFGGLQPDLLHRVIADDDVAAGLPARFLWALPPTPAIRWSDKRVPEHLESTPVALFAQLYALAPNVEVDDDDNPVEKPVAVLLSREATTAMRQFVDDNAVLADEATGGYRAALAKIPAQAARLALVLHCAADACGEPHSAKITGETMQKAITLASWFRREAQRLYSLRSESDDDRQVRELVEWITRHGGQVTPRDLVRGYRGITDTAAAELALNDLASKGIGAWQVLASATNQKRVFKIHPAESVTDSPETSDLSESVSVDSMDDPEIEFSDDPMEAFKWTPV